jgi:hypothetical protein
VSDRSCGSCSLCCKLLAIDELGKAAGDWCVHVVRGKGCSVYESRPDSCRAFRCYWLDQAMLDEAWRPDRSGLILRDVGSGVLLVEVEPSKPDAWRRPPFLDQLRRWSQMALANGGMVVVKLRGSATVLLPDADLPIGRVADSDDISVGYELQGGLRRPFAKVTSADGGSRKILG